MIDFESDVNYRLNRGPVSILTRGNILLLEFLFPHKAFEVIFKLGQRFRHRKLMISTGKDYEL